ncbi:transcription factor ibh1 [Phtheirospermum japonicum]|uniref:Transcription factor ibh1 n=1 Tax=Phtheirospermum japonicum TaxID=374723 RepID=A0A830CYL0_9LAMI|nr:transcription factor ibh1 [Phtheirospermum japonicum]
MKATPRNPSSIKTMLASRFLGAMKKLKNNNSTPSMADKRKRYHAIRAAAYASMASVVGPNKAWSRALLRKIKKQRKTTHHHHATNPRSDLGFLGPENDLRKLVPGGKALDFGRLLNETSDYIQCLRAQVEVMRMIVDYSSNFSF